MASLPLTDEECRLGLHEPWFEVSDLSPSLSPPKNFFEKLRIWTVLCGEYKEKIPRINRLFVILLGWHGVRILVVVCIFISSQQAGKAMSKRIIKAADLSGSNRKNSNKDWVCLARLAYEGQADVCKVKLMKAQMALLP